jgi:hypothetical protein
MEFPATSAFFRYRLMPCLSACRNFDSTLVGHLSDDEGFIAWNMSSDTPDRMMLEGGALHCRGRSDPSGQSIAEPLLGLVPHPCHVPVGPNQDGRRNSDLP